MLLGIDIGGTAVKVGALTPEGRILARRRLPFDAVMPFEELLASIVAACRTLEAEAGERARAVGVCMPGFVERASGRIIDGGSNVPALKDSSLPEQLSLAMGVPVRVENDGIAATLGELHFGAGRGLSRFVLLTIGTGVGGAVAIDGAVLTGARGEPPELGAIVLRAEGVDGTGGPRTVEHLASAAAFRNAYRKRAGGRPAPELPEIFGRADTDPAARGAIAEVSGHIAHVLGMLVNTLNLEACLIGGGVAGAGEALLSPVRARLADFTWPLLLRNVRVLPAERGNDAGLLGAARLALDTSAESARPVSALPAAINRT